MVRKFAYVAFVAVCMMLPAKALAQETFIIANQPTVNGHWVRYPTPLFFGRLHQGCLGNAGCQRDVWKLYTLSKNLILDFQSALALRNYPLHLKIRLYRSIADESKKLAVLTAWFLKRYPKADRFLNLVEREC